MCVRRWENSAGRQAAAAITVQQLLQLLAITGATACSGTIYVASRRYQLLETKVKETYVIVFSQSSGTRTRTACSNSSIIAIQNGQVVDALAEK